MVLQSQQIRSGVSRRNASVRKKKSKTKLFLIAFVIGMIGFLIWSFTGDDENSGTIDDNQSGAGTPLAAGNNNDSGQSGNIQTPPLQPPGEANGSGNQSPPANGNTPVGPNHPGVNNTPNNIIPTPTDQATAESVRSLIDRGRRLIQENKLVEGRKLLNAALVGRISNADAKLVRQEMAKVNQTLVFSPRITPNDPMVTSHTVKSGEYMSTISRGTNAPWELIARINQVNPNRMQIGKRLKIVKGPFHMVVFKHDFRGDLYGEINGDPVYIRSFKVGLGKHDATPVGKFQVKRNSKLKNPEWPNPRTGEIFHADDLKNPIGERWIGLKGIDANTQVMSGYGLHGTIDPQSIGTEASMGCIRFLADDIALVYDMLISVKSKVSIKP